MQKIKQGLGIGGVKVKLAADPNLVMASRSTTGSIEFNSKTDQFVTKLIVQLIEHRSTGKGEDKKQQKFDLGEALIAQDIEVKAGVPAKFDFTMPFSVRQTVTDKMQAKGGMLGVMGKLGSMAEHEKVEYKLSAHASVKGRMMAASHHLDVKMV